jgi:hypothetical protein
MLSPKPARSWAASPTLVENPVPVRIEVGWTVSVLDRVGHHARNRTGHLVGDGLSGGTAGLGGVLILHPAFDPHVVAHHSECLLVSRNPWRRDQRVEGGPDEVIGVVPLSRSVVGGDRLAGQSRPDGTVGSVREGSESGQHSGNSIRNFICIQISANGVAKFVGFVNFARS